MKMSVMTQLIRIVEPKSAVHIPLQPSKSPGIPVGSLPVYLMYQTIDAFWYPSAGHQLLSIVVLRDPGGRRLDDCFFFIDHISPLQRLLPICADGKVQGAVLLPSGIFADSVPR